MEHRFETAMWRYPGAAGWRFVTLPVEVADDIAATAESGGFGSVRVAARIGSTSWETSIFPSKTDSSYLLPVKAAVRAAERIGDGDLIVVALVVGADRSGGRRSSSTGLASRDRSHVLRSTTRQGGVPGRSAER